MNNLSEKIILKLSNPTSFERGKKYYLPGRVTEYVENDEFMEATVIGADLYKVKISKIDLTSECNCPAFKGEEFCKHQVAVLLTKKRWGIIPKKKPSIKNKGIDANINRDQQFKSSLQNIPRENLINEVTELGRSNPDIEEYFIHKYSEKTADYYRQIELNIKKKINSILGYRGKKDFTGKVFAASREVNSLLQNLPPSRHSTDFLLKTGYWISEKLADIDDSFGYLSDLIREMIENSCEYLNYARTEDLILFYKYTSLNTDFDFNIDVIQAILDKVTNPKIIEAIITKLEKSIYKKDPDFGFNPEYGWELMMNFLRHNNPAKYEELIPEVIDKSITIKFDYINCLYEMGRYEDVIRYGSDKQNHREIENAFEKSILALNKKQQIIDYYIKRLKEQFDLNTFKHFSEIDGIKEMPEWRNAVTNILTDNKYIFYHADLLLYLRRYDDFIEFISSKGEEYYQNNSVIEKYAVRFMITDPPMAVKLYHYLIENEVERIKKSKRYFSL